MNQRIFTALALFAICLTTIIITVQAGQSQFLRADEINRTESNNFLDLISRNQDLVMSRTCALKPSTNRTNPKQSNNSRRQLPLERFRSPKNSANLSLSTSTTDNPPSFLRGSTKYNPKETVALADSTNFGERFVFDLYGKPAYHPPIVVLHETVGSASSAINFFRTPHPIESQQVSYHTLVKRDGELVYLVPPDKRAFGAGDSIFANTNSKESVKTHPEYPSSVNNFAYHISLETPSDGRDNGSSHSGYTTAQYQSLAWLVAKTGVPASRTTTHKFVDRSGQRQDPRSFNGQTFLRLLEAQPKSKEIIIDCQPPA
jgi:N-acetylmuramoyl-L-alanine amidase